MNRGPIIVRYTQAFFELGKQKELLDRFYDDCMLLLGYLNEVEKFRIFLRSPVIRPTQKKSLFADVFGKQLNPYTLNFLNLVVDKNRENFLKDMLMRFEHLYKQEKGIKSVLLITAVPLKKAFQEKLVAFMEKEFNSSVEMTSRVNEEIERGFILKVDNNLLDNSIVYQMRQLKKQLLS